MASSPAGRKGRVLGSVPEGRLLRDLSPTATLRAFTQQPLPFDTTRDDYRIFACIDTLTPAERDLGVRVAKAAQRLQSWCAEIEQWGWPGSFEPPSAAVREQRRRSIEARVREHVVPADSASTIPPLEYWGSLLSVEVEQHEARLDDMHDELLLLDVEELKEYVLDMHPATRPRPVAASLDTAPQSYRPLDDFSFLITQTLLSALPHHAQLKERLHTWTARVAILRAAPRFINDLYTAQTALRLGWDAIELPTDTTNNAFTEWRDAVDTISRVLQGKVSDLGQRLDRMLDTLEGRQDCLPDTWIDTFEETETDYGRWAHESRRRVIELQVRMREDRGSSTHGQNATEEQQSQFRTPLPETPGVSKPESASVPSTASPKTPQMQLRSAPNILLNPLTSPESFARGQQVKSPDIAKQTPPRIKTSAGSASVLAHPSSSTAEHLSSDFNSKVVPKDAAQKPADSLPSTSTARAFLVGSGHREPITPGSPLRNEFLMGGPNNMQTVPGFKQPAFQRDQVPRIALGPASSPSLVYSPDSAPNVSLRSIGSLVELAAHDDESEMEEGDTVLHYEQEDSQELSAPILTYTDLPPRFQNEDYDNPHISLLNRSIPFASSSADASMSTDGDNSALFDPPQTPRSRASSISSLSSERSFDSGSPSNVEESPSVRKAAIRTGRAPRPELNAAMSKRRATKMVADDVMPSPPWPPTSFVQKSTNSADDLERKISDILTTIPAHIRLTSGPEADAPEVKSRRGLVAKGSHAYLRAKRSVSGVKSPELTLSPAKSEEAGQTIAGRRSAANLRGDNDIKLYHLTQPGKEQPVKLFIRRVGENGERVMVRVGGGWADLGEYLRQYAEHHGRRTASDGKFEILGLEVKNSDSSPARPDSATSRPDRRFSGGTSASSIATPLKPSETGFANNEVPDRLSSFSIPDTGEEPFVPSTNSSQRSWQGNEVGLAGPNSKKLDLSGQKLEWIEGMMKQARTVSGNLIAVNNQTPLQREERGDNRGESRSDSRVVSSARNSGFGDLGKVGGTKRIFMRGGKPVVE